MKISTQEEYGLRCALQLARVPEGNSITIGEIAEREGMTTAYVGKLLNLLRQGGLVRSERGRSGGYALARPADQIPVGEVLGALGNILWEPAHCGKLKGAMNECVRAEKCSIRTLWAALDSRVDELLGTVTLKDLLDGNIPRPVRGDSGLEMIEPSRGRAGSGQWAGSRSGEKAGSKAGGGSCTDETTVGDQGLTLGKSE